MFEVFNEHGKAERMKICAFYVRFYIEYARWARFGTLLENAIVMRQISSLAPSHTNKTLNF